MAQIRQVVSESLQATIRRLLPSQQGFTEDLQASNVIQPIIDLTPSAEGSTTQQNLAEALSFGSITAYTAAGSTVTLANTAGFWRITGTAVVEPNSGASATVTLTLSDGLSSKNAWKLGVPASGSTTIVTEQFDYIVFLPSGHSASLAAVSSDCSGIYYQIADVSGNIVTPSGFSPS